MTKNALLGIVFLFMSSCYYEDVPRMPDPFTCDEADISVTAVAKSSVGCDVANGSITATGSGGSAPYTFSIDGGHTMKSPGVFTNLQGGHYSIILYDALGCSDTTDVTVEITGSDFAGHVEQVVPDTDCVLENGSVTLSATGGTAPYTFKLGASNNTTGSFSALAAGTYNATISDAAGCSINFSVTIPDEALVSYADDIVPILTARCNFPTCHGGKSSAKNFTTYENVRANAAEIKLRTENGNMPKEPKPGGAVTANEIKIIACWVDAGAPNN